MSENGMAERSYKVDELRVHGSEGLRVVDASIMPAITSANTNAPCILIGEFVAHRLMSSMHETVATAKSECI